MIFRILHGFMIYFFVNQFLLAGPANGQGILNINIDAPEFRPMAVAIPDFISDGSSIGTAAESTKELRRILEFCGLFRVVSPAAYNHIPIDSLLKEGESKLVAAPWKQVGIEALIVGSVKSEKDLKVIEIRAFDISRSKEVAGKRYSQVDSPILSMRKFGDRVLMAFTGKRGIFTTKIVFVGRRNKGDAKQIFYSDFDGGNLVQVTTKNTPHLSPSWSQDGQSIIYTSFETGDPNLFIYDILRKKSRIVSGEAGLDSGAQFDPKGNYFAYSHAVAGDTDIYLRSTSQSKSIDFIKGNGLDVDPVFSPDGRYLAWVSGRFGNPHIFRANLKWNGGLPMALSDERLTFAGWYNATPAWSHDSEKIAFASYDKEINRFDLFMMNPDGRKLERLTLRSGDNESPSFSPNSQLILFHSSRKGTADVKGPTSLHMMFRDGSNQRKLDLPLYEAQTPKWGPFIDFDK